MSDSKEAGDAGAKTYSAEEVATLLAAKEEEHRKATDGLTRNHRKLLDEKKALESKFKPLLAEGFDPEDADMIGRLLNDAKQGKLDELLKAKDIDGFKKAIAADTERQFRGVLKKNEEAIAEKQKELEAEKERADRIKGELRKIRVLDRLRKAAVDAGVAGGPQVETVVLMGDRLFDVDDEDGQVYAIRDGKKVPAQKGGWLTPEDWIRTELKSSHGFLWPSSQGVGAKGSPNGSASADGKTVITQEDFAKLSSVEQAAFSKAFKEGKAAFRQ